MAPRPGMALPGEGSAPPIEARVPDGSRILKRLPGLHIGPLGWLVLLLVLGPTAAVLYLFFSSITL